MAANASRPRKDRLINLRATSVQESLIRAAADKRGLSMTDFVLESACTRAEETIADQVHFVLSDRRGSRSMSQRRALGSVARQFYMRFDFEPSPMHPLHLMLLMKDIRASRWQH
jgi:uncharacterized protein (DUF1778 family)